MSIEVRLIAEIEKWSKRLDKSLASVNPCGEEGDRMLRNIKAYREDSRHFLKKDDLIKSFECLVWAWAILEVGKEIGFLRTNPSVVENV